MKERKRLNEEKEVNFTGSALVIMKNIKMAEAVYHKYDRDIVESIKWQINKIWNTICDLVS